MKKIINTKNAPAPIGPYSQAVFANGILFASGQIAIVPETGELVTSSVQDETQQIMKNIAAVLQEHNLDFSHVVKTTIFLTDMAYFVKVNEIYASYFQDNFPARETVAVKGLPKNANVEITVTAVQ
ncbi:MAG: RidA family protein [Alphaproteobacteria bacterium]|nr:RidA family protein [Alphaproteobacteria bacterium]